MTKNSEYIYARVVSPPGVITISPISEMKGKIQSFTTVVYVSEGQYINPEHINSIFYWKCDMSVEGVTVSRFTYITINAMTGEEMTGVITVDCDSWKVLSSTVEPRKGGYYVSK